MNQLVAKAARSRAIRNENAKRAISRTGDHKLPSNTNLRIVSGAAEAKAPDHSRVLAYLENEKPATPCLVIDLDIVAGKYGALKSALPAADIFYAVKANPAPEVLRRLVSLGSSFDTASAGEIRQ